MNTPEQTSEIVQVASSADFSIISLVMSADLVGKSVILLLIGISIWSWTIIISKMMLLSSLKKKIAAFENLFWSGQVIDKLYEKVQRSVDNPLSAVFVSAMNECQKSKSIDNSRSEVLKVGYKDRVLQSMYLARNREVETLESRLSFLATVGSTSPFIGLFGTVLGIMHSFQSIAASKNTTLAVIAPGFAEALFATAVGLFAAIPAFLFYNFLMAEVDNISNKTDDFIGELHSLLSRAIDEEKM